MGVKSFWKKSLGEFRQEDRKLISSLSHNRIAIDTSAWMHTQDGIWEVQYARTLHPKYPHPIIIRTFAARIRTLGALHIHPIFVFDGASPTTKKKINRERQEKSALAADQYKYTATIEEIKAGTYNIDERSCSKLGETNRVQYQRTTQHCQNGWRRMMLNSSRHHLKQMCK
mmetsp:Transcript_40001/g.84022  ORF Transcript_40001/g.84022 Transcript_40001/m.84022 type:complete len:171 (+) Transcript_40001:208-720(+)